LHQLETLTQLKLILGQPHSSYTHEFRRHGFHRHGQRRWPQQYVHHIHIQHGETTANIAAVLDSWVRSRSYIVGYVVLASLPFHFAT